MNNREIREAAKLNGVNLWEVADALGVADSTFYRQLRRELSESLKEEILEIIKRISKERS